MGEVKGKGKGKGNAEKFKEIIDAIKVLGIEVNQIRYEDKEKIEDTKIKELEVYERKYGKGTKEAYEEYLKLDSEGYEKTFEYGSYERDLYEWAWKYRSYISYPHFKLDESKIN